MNQRLMLLPIGLLFCGVVAVADDWPRFRGPAGSGIAPDSELVPSEWSPTKNVSWKIPLPGPGASSPIIVGNKVLVTCYSGYGVNRENPGAIENLVRNLVCIDLRTGDQLWQKDVPASLPEDPYDKSGVSSHGYASHTPVSDGVNVYCFFGKGGVYAFDLNGNALWNAEAGKESDPPRWGSSSSPIVHENTVIVTAAAESQSIIGFDKRTGENLWQQYATGLDGMWGTPTLVQVDEDRADVVMLVARELWGLDPKSGKLRWFADATSSQQAYTSVISQGNRVFAFSGAAAGSVALDIEVREGRTDTSPAWNSSASATYGTPVRHQSKLYVVSRGILTILNAKTGDRLEQIRLRNFKKIGNARFGSLDYASPVVVGDRLFYLSAGGQMYVFKLGEKTELLAVNEMTTETETFWGTPAVSAGRLVVRSSKNLYCIADGIGLTKTHDEPIDPADRQQSNVVSDDAPMVDNEKVLVRDIAEEQFRKDAADAKSQSVPSSTDAKPERPQRPIPAED
jgi:outer membrane protein assembly factor BamB